MKLTKEDIKLLVEINNKMDSGELEFVLLRGHRIIITKTEKEEFGLVPGQTITDVIYDSILEFKIEKLKSDIDKKNIQDSNPKDFE